MLQQQQHQQCQQHQQQSNGHDSGACRPAHLRLRSVSSCSFLSLSAASGVIWLAMLEAISPRPGAQRPLFVRQLNSGSLRLLGP
jgi:hypothetical protein